MWNSVGHCGCLSTAAHRTYSTLRHSWQETQCRRVVKLCLRMSWQPHGSQQEPCGSSLCQHQTLPAKITRMQSSVYKLSLSLSINYKCQVLTHLPTDVMPFICGCHSSLVNQQCYHLVGNNSQQRPPMAGVNIVHSLYVTKVLISLTFPILKIGIKQEF